MTKNIGGSLKIIGVAISTVTGPTLTTVNRAGIEVPFNITRHEKIEPAITIVINPAGAGGPAAATYRCFCRDVSEGSVAVVVIQIITTVAGDIKISMTVVVIVGRGDSHAVAAAFQSRSSRNIFKGTVGFLVIKPV